MQDPILTSARRSAPALVALVSGLVALACGGDGNEETRFEVETVSLSGGAAEPDLDQELVPALGADAGRSQRVAIVPDAAPGAAVDASAASLAALPAAAPSPLERVVHELVATLRARGPLEHPHARGGSSSSSGVPGFDGTGGPGGTFDVHVPPGTTLVFDTIQTVFVGGPGGAPTTTQVAVGGVLDVRDLYVPESSILKVQGPNPVRILATGNVVIEGQLVASGGSSNGVVTLLTATIPEPGAAGVAGGGRGGTGSYLTTQVTPRGGTGLGPFGTSPSPASLGGPHGGGRGGEAGYNSVGNADTGRRPGGGGGGAFAADVVLAVGSESCADQNIVGLDGEQGFDGSPVAVGVVSGSSPPQGGKRGASPFVDGTSKNDFWGKLVLPDGTIVGGELQQPWAGSGGGAGGDTVRGGVYPLVGPFLPSSSEKGAGGGGGGGQVRIQALGDVVLGPRGTIDVRGGNGGGGESSAGINRIGGGSGGGSGGHLIVETASRIDLRMLNGTFPGGGAPSARDVGLLAPGGQGGAGADNVGGAVTNGIPLPPCRDAMPGLSPACLPTSCPSCAPIVCAGGDGGPGVIQLHVPALDGDTPGSGDLIPPTQAASTLFRRGVVSACSAANPNAIKNAGVIKPPPVGAPGDVTAMNDTVGWGRLVPTFAVPAGTMPSSWIPLDAAGLPDVLPRPAGVAVELQATTATLSGAPDETPGAASEWVAGPDELGGLGEGTEWAFVRVRVRLADGAPAAAAPVAAAPLDVLRVPFSF